MFKKIFILFLFVSIMSCLFVDSVNAQDKTEVTKKTDKEKKSDGDTAGTVTESKTPQNDEKEQLEEENTEDEEEEEIEKKDDNKSIDKNNEEKKPELDKKAQREKRRAERQARREKKLKIRQAKIDKISLDAKTDRKAKKAQAIKEKRIQKEKRRAERRAKKNKENQIVENTEQPKAVVEKTEKKQELDPIPNPQKSSILVEASPSLKFRKIYPDSFVFKSPDISLENSNCVVTLKDGIISESSKAVLASSKTFFVKIDISKRPEVISDSIDSVLNSFNKFVISDTGIRHRIKGVIFDAFSDFENSQWKGHEEELNTYFSMLSKGIKKYDNDFLVGGVGFNSVFDGVGEYKDPSAHIKSFLDFISRLKIPCDFIYLNTGNLMPYNYFLEPAFLKSKILPEYSDLKLKIYVSISDFISESSDKDMGMVLSIQNAICALKSSADFVELPDSINNEIAKNTFGRFFENEVKYSELNDTKGLDRLSFVAESAVNDSNFVIIFAVSNPSKWINDNSDSDEAFVKKFEEEYRILVHKFTDGFFSPEYTRFRMSLTDCNWSNKEVKMERFLVNADGSCNLVEEENMEGRSEYFFNKSVSAPSVMVIKFSVSEPAVKEEKKTEDK